MKPVLLELGPVRIYSMGVFLVLAVLSGAFVVYKKGKEYHFEVEEIFDVMFGSLFGGLVGGRLVYIAFHFEQFGGALLRWLWVTHYVGINFWGALAAAVIYLAVRSKREREKVFEWLDVFSLGAMLGLGIGMIGALFNGSWVGIASNWPIAIYQVGYGEAVPVQLLAAGLLIGAFAYLMVAERKYRTFEWYRAGKTEAKSGFIFFMSLVMIGGMFLLLAKLRIKQEWLMPVVFLLTGAIGLYERSGREWKEDIQSLGGDKEKIEQLDNQVRSRWERFKK